MANEGGGQGGDSAGGPTNTTPLTARQRLDPSLSAIAEIESHRDLNVEQIFQAIVVKTGELVQTWDADGFDLSQSVMQLVGWDPWSSYSQKMPSRYQPGVLGWSRIWVHYYRKGVRKGFFAPLTPERGALGRFICSCVTWHYPAPSDAQTSLVIKVEPLVYALPPLLASYKAIAERLAAQFAQALKA